MYNQLSDKQILTVTDKAEQMSDSLSQINVLFIQMLYNFIFIILKLHCDAIIFLINVLVNVFDSLHRCIHFNINVYIVLTD